MLLSNAPVLESARSATLTRTARCARWIRDAQTHPLCLEIC
ncbi:DNA-dependent RNA polymerase beta' subunit/160 kD subunit [Giardia duodenalis assemblage B]|uniref:DNA-dependent RNA polymerase beta' subunit/160 kD subunit n=1 Tax=Giardia duodenalis assemblage B TaxID=1394984 RepID=A0A132NW39_GIAIN|nr:DNA-dependent RNA polymerase beta' subunit/160 kD subunit [Giardia intestinalis assemblage B]